MRGEGRGVVAFSCHPSLHYWAMRTPALPLPAPRLEIQNAPCWSHGRRGLWRAFLPLLVDDVVELNVQSL